MFESWQRAAGSILRKTEDRGDARSLLGNLSATGLGRLQRFFVVDDFPAAPVLQTQIPSTTSGKLAELDYVTSFPWRPRKLWRRNYVGLPMDQVVAAGAKNELPGPWIARRLDDDQKK